MSEHELRWQLRQLPREIDPPRDLWPGIAARLAAPAPARRRWPDWLALAACLCLAVGLAASLKPAPPAPAESPRAELVQREADALTREYLAALGQFRGAPLPEPLQPALDTLDRSALEIREALAADPDAVYLLDQLKRTYTRRLTLTQRALVG